MSFPGYESLAVVRFLFNNSKGRSLLSGPLLAVTDVPLQSFTNFVVKNGWPSLTDRILSGGACGKTFSVTSLGAALMLEDVQREKQLIITVHLQTIHSQRKGGSQLLQIIILL